MYFPVICSHCESMLAMRAGNMHAPIATLSLESTCSCYTEIHGCFPFRAFHTSQFFKFHQYPEDAVLGCRDDLCPPCISCSQSHYHPASLSEARQRMEGILGSSRPTIQAQAAATTMVSFLAIPSSLFRPCSLRRFFSSLLQIHQHL